MRERGLAGLWWRDLRDRLRGESGRANARWGFLSPPPGPGKLIWIKAGGDDDSLLLGAELTRATRRKRLDVRLAFTFERDTPLLAPGLQGLKGVGVGYGPAEVRAAVRRVLARFDPLGVIFAGTAPSVVLSQALEARGVQSVVVAAGPRTGTRVNAAYPANESQAQAWRAHSPPTAVAPAADPLTLLVEPQVDPNFKTLIAGGRDLALWWLSDVSEREATSVARAWMASPLAASDVLFVGGAGGAIESAWAPFGGIGRLSRWHRAALAPGTAMLVDEARWLPALAASCTAVHLRRPTRAVFWQALAGGCPVSLGTSDARGYLNDPTTDDLLPVVDPIAAVIARWEEEARDVMAARRRGDALRRLFWQERRRAAERGDQLLQRVYDW